MNTKNIVINAIIICAILGASFGVYQMSRLEKETLWIALAVPMSGAGKTYGDEIKQAIDIYLDKVNQEEWLHGRQIKVRVFDDKNKAKNAMQVASEIAASNDLLITLGHYSSSASMAAGRIYRKNAIPVITASATVDRVTSGNQWYFRVIPNNAVQFGFIANYIKNILNKKSVSIISINDNAYGSDMAQHFKKASQKIGLDVNRSWMASSQPGQMEQDLKKIIMELRSVKNPGMIFIGADSFHSPHIISLLKHAVGDYTVIGADSFTTSLFLNAFKNYPREQEQPGYYSNGIFATTHILFDIANREALRFRKKFLTRYNREPSWVGACYYDAMHVAVEAIKNAEISGHNNIRKKRNEIRTALASINSYVKAVPGLRGPIFFNRNGDAEGALSICYYQDRKLIPASVQYHLMPGLQDSSDTLKEALKDKTITVDGQIMKKTQVVYTGIDINEISNMDMANNRFTVDFYLWFRFKKDFYVSGIEFENAIKPVALNHMFLETKKDGYKIIAFHLKADFKGDFNFNNYPFDEHTLPIRFHHSFLIRNSLVFVPDILGMPLHGQKNVGKTKFNAVTGWVIDQVKFYQDIISYVPGFGEKKQDDFRKTVKYSRFNTDIQIKRQGYIAAAKKYFPILVLIVCLYLIYFMPPRWRLIRMQVILGVLLINGAFHYHHKKYFWADCATPYEHSLWAVYGLVLLAILLSIPLFASQRKGDDQKIRWIMYAGVILHPIILLAAWGGAKIG